MSLQELQKEIYENKKRHGFNTTDLKEEFCHLYGEVAEAFEAYYKNEPKEDFAEELADVAIFLLGIAEISGVDLEQEIIKKVKKNKTRKYVQNDLGHYVHT